jgi:hypothetical protein
MVLFVEFDNAGKCDKSVTIFPDPPNLVKPLNAVTPADTFSGLRQNLPRSSDQPRPFRYQTQVIMRPDSLPRPWVKATEELPGRRQADNWLKESPRQSCSRVSVHTNNWSTTNTDACWYFRLQRSRASDLDRPSFETVYSRRSVD